MTCMDGSGRDASASVDGLEVSYSVPLHAFPLRRGLNFLAVWLEYFLLIFLESFQNQLDALPGGRIDLALLRQLSQLYP